MDNLQLQGTTVESELQKNGVYASVTSGISMRPLFKTNRDMVILKRPESEPKKYDVVLYKVASGRYVLHRIVKVTSDKLVIRGDNTFSLEYVDKGDIIGILTEFNRNGRRVSVDNKLYIVYSRIWNFIYPLRLIAHKVISLLKRVYRKIFR